MDMTLDMHRARMAPLAGTLERTPGSVMAMLVLRGSLQWEAPGHAAALPAGMVVVDDGRAVQRWSGAPGARTEVLCLWHARHGAPLPMVHDAGSRLAEAMQRLADALSRAGARRLQGATLQPVVDAWHAAERDCEAQIARCHGRTVQRRRELFVRLARARTLLSLPDVAIDVAACASVARLSTCHFVRLFHKVFEEAPHRFRSRGRMQSARRLVEETDLPMHEVMRRVGYDSAPIFSRAFRRHFGASASAMRGARVLPVLARIGPTSCSS